MIPKYGCKKCGHNWMGRMDSKPILCPRCKNPKWWEERKRFKKGEK